jgi:streptogramin lyase
MVLRSIAAILLAAGLVLAAGNVNVTIKEWDTPSPNTHPHDTEAGPDGSLWYTGQYANVIGRLDVVTGKIREYRLKTPDSGPHGLGRQGRQHLVHCEQQGVHRKAQSQFR